MTQPHSLTAMVAFTMQSVLATNGIEKHVNEIMEKVMEIGIQKDDVDMARLVEHNIKICNGMFPDDVIGVKFYTGRMSAKELVEKTYSDEHASVPKVAIHRMLIRSLFIAGVDKANCLKWATEIEDACRKFTKDDDEYGIRCGLINRLLNPKSESCKQFGQVLLNKIKNGEIFLESIGNIPEHDLCPDASKTERNEIAIRLMQKVEVKVSDFFQCPNCKTRKCTYRMIQRRALDEAPDYSCECQNCGIRFTGRI